MVTIKARMSDKSDRRISRVGGDVLAVYFSEIKRNPVLSRSEESALARRAKRGDECARKKLIQANLRFVVNVARKFHSCGLPFEDLISEGNIGLMTALEHFDPDRGYHFISYAVWWIRQSIHRAIAEKSRLIRLPQNKAQELQRIEKTREELVGEQHRNPEPDQIAQRLSCSSTRVLELLSLPRDLLSLDTSLGHDDGFPPLEELVEDRNGRLPEDVILESSLRDDINSALGTLSTRESEILQRRFGLNGKRPMSLRAIGRTYKLTKERIRQIEKRAIKRLKDPERRRALRTYYE